MFLSGDLRYHSTSNSLICFYVKNGGTQKDKIGTQFGTDQTRTIKRYQATTKATESKNAWLHVTQLRSPPLTHRQKYSIKVLLFSHF